MKRFIQIFIATAGIWAATALSQDHAADTAASDSHPKIPAGVVPTPAQTRNPMILGIGMLVVGVGMGFILFGRRTTSKDRPEGDSQ